MAILVIAALVILGPERLPGAMSWVAKSLKQVREYATGAQSQLKEELGPEFDDLKKPFDELRGLRGMTPRGMITKHLLDGDDSIFTGNFEEKPQTQQQPPAQIPPAPNMQAQPPVSFQKEPPPPAAARYDDEAT